jgi:hypothetical protein
MELKRWLPLKIKTVAAINEDILIYSLQLSAGLALQCTRSASISATRA